MSLFDELKRRNVIRSAIAYAAVGWLMVEVGSVILPAFDAPQWALRALIIAVVAGLLPTLVLAWRYDLTARGVMEESAAQAVGQDSLVRGRRFDVAIIAVLALALALVIAERLTLEDRAGASRVLGVAVMPFDNLSLDAADAYIAGGVHEEVLTYLARIPELRVISRTSMLRIAESGFEVPEIGERLGVSHLLEGSVRRDGDRVRVTVQLIDAAADRHLWGENFDRKLTDLFKVQSDVALAIAAQLHLELSPDTVATIAEVPTADPKAYALFLRVIDEFRSDRYGGDVETVIGLLEQAVTLDPDFLQAKVLLAGQLGRMSLGSLDPDGTYRARALKLVTEIRQRWPNHVLARRALGHYYYTVEEDYARALDEYQAVVAVLPSDIVAVVNIRNAYKRVDRREEFLYWAQRAVDISPESLPVANELLLALLANRRLDEAIAFTEACAARFPDDGSWEVELVQLQLLRGDADAYLTGAERLKAVGRWGELGTDLSWLYYKRDGLAAAEAHLQARRGDVYSLDAMAADMDHALMLRLEGRGVEAQSIADRALAFAKSEYPVESVGDHLPGLSLFIASVAAVAGDHDAAQAYRLLGDRSESRFAWWLGEIDIAIAYLDALLGDPEKGWARLEPYADDPYHYLSRGLFRVAAYERMLFGSVPAFQAFTAGE